MPCMQCEDAPCEQVCPVAATVHDAQGLNVMVYNRCIGTRYCSNNCPYKVRHFNFFNYTKDTPEILKLAMNLTSPCGRGASWRSARTARSGSIARRSMRRSRDASWPTATSRPPASRPVPPRPSSLATFETRRAGSPTAKADPRNYALLDELNTRPRTTYLAKVRNPNPSDLDGRVRER